MMLAMIAVASALVAMTLAANLYLRESTVSHRMAANAWEAVNARATAILTNHYPAPVQALAMGLAMSTGCGCYVRSLLMEHFFPRLHGRMRRAKDASSAREFATAAKTLDSLQKKTLDELIAHSIAFDLMTNPAQGWVMRRVMAKRFREIKEPTVFSSPSKQERDAVVRTVSRRKTPELRPVAA